MSPHSLPKQRVFTPQRESRPTPPSANFSAVAMAQGVGSSATRSAPHRTAISARTNFSAQAGPPRWVKLPLMAHTTGRPDAPARRSSASCPRCRGSNSHTTPTASMAVPPLHTYFHSILPYFSALGNGLLQSDTKKGTIQLNLQPKGVPLHENRHDVRHGRRN